MAKLTGWRYGMFVGGIVAAIGAALFPITIYPMLNLEEFRKIQAANRAQIRQEEVQPGNMKVWSDPFGRK
ncbi:small integral membrane protein 20 [Halyomorpha halys]|uniref:small integral membrane protein 20 n=1 Tax=Halyomorpha halys TaxID=286706 RepID=UPI0006D4EFA0|nr:small integral membrane protein 20 [Halyomorpha halys]